MEKRDQKRTSSGHIPEELREETATLPGDRFPIFDKKSAVAALGLRGHNTTPSERKKIIEKAAEFAPLEADAARDEDRARRA